MNPIASMVLAAGITLGQQDPLTRVFEHHSKTLQAELGESFKLASSLLSKIADLSERQKNEYSSNHSKLQAAYTSRDWISSDFFTKTWSGLRFVHLKSNGEPKSIHLTSIDPNYNPAHEEMFAKCIKSLELLEEAGFVNVYRDNRGTSYEGGPVLILPVAVTLTEEGKAYVASLKKETKPVAK